MKRQRGRNNGRKPHMPVRSQTFDSSGPDVRIRGNAYQVLEKYLALARDASAAGDRIAAENFYQHAEHYYRVINANGEHHRQQQMHAQGQGQQGQQGHGQQGSGQGQDPRMSGQQPYDGSGHYNGGQPSGQQPGMAPQGQQSNAPNRDDGPHFQGPGSDNQHD